MVQTVTTRQVEEAIAAAIEKIDEDELVQLTCDMVNIPSRRGEELQLAKFVAGYMEAKGFPTEVQQFETNRGNTVSLWKGAGDGPTILFNGHLDTSWVGVPEEDFGTVGGRNHPDFETFLPRAEVRDGYVRGLGSLNMKGGIATYIIATKALKEAGVELRGDVLVTTVSGETECSPVQGVSAGYHGPHYSGSSIGAEWLIKHGGLADYVVVAEPTNCQIAYVNSGYCWVKVLVRGQMAYGGRRGYSNAVTNTIPVMQAIDAWAPQYKEKYSRGPVTPEVVIGAIDGGWPYKPMMTAGACALYVDFRVLPGVQPLQVKRELDAVLRRVEEENPHLKGRIETEMYMANYGHYTDPEHPLVKATEWAYERGTGTPYSEVEKHYWIMNYWADSNVWRRVGIPAVTIGPGALTYHKGGGRYIEIADMVRCAKIYIALLVERGMRTRAELGLE